jgi:hypothetical protein
MRKICDNAPLWLVIIRAAERLLVSPALWLRTVLVAQVEHGVQVPSDTQIQV